MVCAFDIDATEVTVAAYRGCVGAVSCSEPARFDPRGRWHEKYCNWGRQDRDNHPVNFWFSIVEKASWTTPADVRAAFGTADFLADNRAIFDIKGNRYRLVVQIRYAPLFLVYIRFLGTHAEYDRIDATTI
ncbi:MAG: type II toxin-antitoxin system HigB family toxin [Myxococcales bacterium]|nr:type II toxin-antitoxin system HigB family toxin [Myxococcales bacterium]